MEYTVTQVIHKPVKAPEIYQKLRESLQSHGKASDSTGMLEIKGFRKFLGGGLYTATVRFVVDTRADSTTINANVTQKPTIIFWWFTILGSWTIIAPVVAIGVYKAVAPPYVKGVVSDAMTRLPTQL